jgi:hypothetical protein
MPRELPESDANVVETFAQIGERVAGAAARLADSIFGPPLWCRPLAASAPRPTRQPSCRNCRWHREGTPVVCERKDLGVIFDVPTAERIVAERPRPVVALGPRLLARYVTREHVNGRHLAHVDNSRPGIVGQVRIKGRLRRVIIEGHHRAYNARTAGRAFDCYPLDEAETKECLR